MLQAAHEELHVYGAVIETAQLEFKRTHGSHRPERTPEGQRKLQAMWNAWQTGNRRQPWLYAWDGAYAGTDDYLWIGLIEQGNLSQLQRKYWENLSSSN